MFRFFIATQFTTSIFALVLGLIAALIFRLKTKIKAEEEKPAGLWSRAVSLSIDLVLIDFLIIFLAYHGSMRVAGYISGAIIFFYFFFFWLFFQQTPGKMIIRQRIISRSGRLKINQILRRFALYLLLGIGWIPILFNKEKRALHDFVANTKVVYSKNKLEPKKRKLKIFSFVLLGVAVISLMSLIIYGLGERINVYKETESLKFFDIDQNGIQDGILIDADKDGKFETVKYDVSNDRIIDFAIYDLDGDGRGEGLDINNDGRIDGYDFDGDGKIDAKQFWGFFFIYLWKAWFIILGLAFAGVIIKIIISEKNE